VEMMMPQKYLKEIVTEQRREFDKPGHFIKRSIIDHFDKRLKIPHAIIISGLRRVGKSTLLKQIRNTYYSSNSVIYYLNLDDERLADFQTDDFNYLFEIFIEMYGKNGTFFLDEVQNVKGWEKFVRRMIDKGFKFIITGSNSSMLSRELGSRLTGRYINVELFPFSFIEYMDFKKMNLPAEILTEERGEIKKIFNDFNNTGGIPEFLIYKEKEILKNLYENILYRDIMVRHKISDERTIKELARYLFSNYSSEISYNGLKNFLGIGSSNTVKNYIDYMEGAYLLFSVPKYDYSVKKQIYSRKKIYLIDSMMAKLVGFSFSKNSGKQLENMVFLELKRREFDIYYHNDKFECDFLVLKDMKINSVIQVTHDLEENKDREYRGLLEAINKFKLKEGIILTYDDEGIEKIDNKMIKVIPVWKWLLNIS
jgi:uncharacterized protein